LATTPYALAADVVAWVGAGQTLPVTAEITRLIRDACIVIDEALIGFVYPSDVNLNPTDAATIQAFNDATCAQVEWWVETGDEFGDGTNIASYSIEGASVTFRKAPPRLAPRAEEVLRVAGILPSVTPIHMP
jgi:hypothetical protein